MEDILHFNLMEYRKTTRKYLIQVGQQLRKVTSIYQVVVPEYKKLWLTGTKNLDKCEWQLQQEIEYLNLSSLDKGSVEMMYTHDIKEFDILLSKHVVFVDLFDAAANNTVVECIVRNTPIVVAKLEGVVEYLGEDYPLYFHTLEEVPGLLTMDNIVKAYDYLCNMDKRDLEMSYFIKRLMSSLYRSVV